MRTDHPAFVTTLKRYREVATDAAKLHQQVAEQERKTRKLLAIDAMELVANHAMNPVTSKEHSWTSATEQVKDSAHADDLFENMSELRYTTETAEIEARIAWAEVLFIVRGTVPDAN